MKNTLLSHSLRRQKHDKIISIEIFTHSRTRNTDKLNNLDLFIFYWNYLLFLDKLLRWRQLPNGSTNIALR